MFDIKKILSDKKGAYSINPVERNDHDKPKLLEQVKSELRLSNYSKRTEETYIGWIKRFILFRNKRQPIGHILVETIMLYTHVLNKGLGVKSP